MNKYKAGTAIRFHFKIRTPSDTSNEPDTLVNPTGSTIDIIKPDGTKQVTGASMSAVAGAVTGYQQYVFQSTSGMTAGIWAIDVYTSYGGYSNRQYVKFELY